MRVQSDRRRGRRQSFHAVVLGVVLLAGLLVRAAPTAADGGAARHQAVVRPCPGRAHVLCGTIEVPLYWSAPLRGRLHVHFKVFLHTDTSRHALEPIVAMEGGPGYPSTASAASYLFMIGALHRRHDLILMDQRGTGASDAIDCPGVQNYEALVRPGDYPAVVAACARRLGDRANAYGSAAVAEDLRAVLDAIHVSKIDLYGDSYGSYAAQVFAVHYPRFVRDLVLDGTYDQRFDPLEPEAVTALRRRGTPLSSSFPGCKHEKLLRGIASFDRRLARHPIVGVADDQSHTRRRFDLTAGASAQLVEDGTYSYTFFRDLPAALVAVRHDDLVPIERLAAEDVSFDAAGGAPSAYSAGDLEAVSCHDYPTAWDTSSSDRGGRRSWRAPSGGSVPGHSSRSPNGCGCPLDETSSSYGCLRWPRPAVSDPPFPPRSTSRAFRCSSSTACSIRRPSSATPPGWRRPGRSTFVRVANSNHVTAQADFLHCVSVITRRYLNRRAAGDTGCARRVPAQYVVPAFPKSLARAPEADPAGREDDSTKLDRQTAWVTAETVGDALERW